MTRAVSKASRAPMADHSEHILAMVEAGKREHNPMLFQQRMGQ